MIKSLFIDPIDQRYLPNIQDSLSSVSKANALTKKIIRVVELIILLPWLIIKDSAHHLKSCFVKRKSELKVLKVLKISQDFASKHKFKILKAALVGSAYLGFVHPRLREWVVGKVPDWSLSDVLVVPVSKLPDPIKKLLGGVIAFSSVLGSLFFLYRREKLKEKDKRLAKISGKHTNYDREKLNSFYEEHFRELLNKIKITELELKANGWFAWPFIRIELSVLDTELKELRHKHIVDRVELETSQPTKTAKV